MTAEAVPLVVLCNIPDVQQRLGRVLTGPELERAPGLIDEASVLVTSYLGCWPPPAWATSPDDNGDGVPDLTPPAIRIITSRMVARVLAVTTANPPGGEVTQQAVGPFSTTFGAGTTSGAPWLSSTDQATLRPYRCGGGLSVLTLQGEQSTPWHRGTDLEDGERPVIWVDQEGAWRVVPGVR